MSLAEFDHAEVQEGYLYELGRGVIVVSDVPHPRHLMQVNATRRQFAAFDLAHPGRIHVIAAGSECKILLADFESERHPDLAIYKSPPPKSDDVWYLWVPAIVVEIVSRSSQKRDYGEKPEEYMQFGVGEYWILDAGKGEMLVFRRVRGRWSKTTIRPPAQHRTSLLPGFVFDCGKVFEAAEANEK
jgi:Uma2 family endonuclease